MLQQSISPDYIVEFLNETLKLDPLWINRIFTFRRSCNNKITNHPTIQTMCLLNNNVAGVLGLLNGMFGVDEFGRGPISAIMENDNTIFGFCITPSKEKR